MRHPGTSAGVGGDIPGVKRELCWPGRWGVGCVCVGGGDLISPEMIQNVKDGVVPCQIRV